ncbi:hypothetical protein GWI33_008820 [Rhynchophorus ferrugineus]|uniref:Uncharacterized protein n=1 Tax=Rhynchophorus ferrugineus TaxID=354439 RepID=A0A834IHM4_RHYFE|nr:hypothetical protein GWI33_008820 [Rhynchophorus ferrugineus]
MSREVIEFGNNSAWGNGGGRRLANKLANPGQASQQANIWIPQSQLEELKQSVFQAVSAQITAMSMSVNGH